MLTQTGPKQAPARTQFDVCLGKSQKPLGRLIFVKDGQREFSQFAYSEAWLADPEFFEVSFDLQRQMLFFRPGRYRARRLGTTSDRARARQSPHQGCVARATDRSRPPRQRG